MSKLTQHKLLCARNKRNYHQQVPQPPSNPKPIRPPHGSLSPKAAHALHRPSITGTSFSEDSSHSTGSTSNGGNNNTSGSSNNNRWTSAAELMPHLATFRAKLWAGRGTLWRAVEGRIVALLQAVNTGGMRYTASILPCMTQLVVTRKALSDIRSCCACDLVVAL